MDADAPNPRQTYHELRTYSPGDLENLRERAEKELEEIEIKIQDTRWEVERCVREFLRRFSEESPEQAIIEAATDVARGEQSELVNEVLHRPLEVVLRQRYILGLPPTERTSDGTEPVYEEVDNWDSVEHYDTVEDPGAVEEYEAKIYRLKNRIKKLNKLVSEKEEIKQRKDISNKLLSKWTKGEVRLGIKTNPFEGQKSENRKRETKKTGKNTSDLHQSTREYLKLAYNWILEGNHPSGDKPTDLWRHIHKETGKSKRTIRKTFKRHGWYDPHAGAAPGESTTPSSFTVQSIREEGRKRFGETEQ